MPLNLAPKEGRPATAVQARPTLEAASPLLSSRVSGASPRRDANRQRDAERCLREDGEANRDGATVYGAEGGAVVAALGGRETSAASSLANRSSAVQSVYSASCDVSVEAPTFFAMRFITNLTSGLYFE